MDMALQKQVTNQLADTRKADVAATSLEPTDVEARAYIMSLL